MRRISRDMLMVVIAAAGVSIVIYTTSAQSGVSSPAQKKPGATPLQRMRSGPSRAAVLRTSA